MISFQYRNRECDFHGIQDRCATKIAHPDLRWENLDFGSPTFGISALSTTAWESYTARVPTDGATRTPL